MNDLLNSHKAYLLKLKQIDLNIDGFNRNKKLPKYSQGIIEQGFIITDYDGKGNEMVIIFMADDRLDMVLSSYGNDEIVLEKRDITAELISHQIKDQSLLRMVKKHSDNELLQEFYHYHLTVDDVLDKIIDFGISSLNNLEKQILQDGYTHRK